jgi:hypothetical protein
MGVPVTAQPAPVPQAPPPTPIQQIQSAINPFYLILAGVGILAIFLLRGK